MMKMEITIGAIEDIEKIAVLKYRRDLTKWIDKAISNDMTGEPEYLLQMIQRHISGESE